MDFAVTVLADSTNAYNDRLITTQLTYPRMIHSELMTYRRASRNAASSRAIPLAKVRRIVTETPAKPVFWGSHNPGMGAAAELQGEDRIKAEDLWLKARDQAIAIHQEMETLGGNKEWVNRILEPFMWMTTVFTANLDCYRHLFFERCHKDAQREFQVIAGLMQTALKASVPMGLADGDWHLPYIQAEDADEVIERRRAKGEDTTQTIMPEDTLELAKISAARCARVSYLTQDGKKDQIKDLERYELLLHEDHPEDPGHFSPLEHPAKAGYYVGTSNFTGFLQLRKMYPQREFSLAPW